MVDGSEQTCMHARWKGKSDSMCVWRNGHGVNIILVMKITINKQILCIAVHVVRTWCIFIVQNDQVVQLAWVIPCRTYSYHKTPRTTQGWNRSSLLISTFIKARVRQTSWFQCDQVVQLAWVIPCRTYSYHKTPRTTQGWNRTVINDMNWDGLVPRLSVRKNIQVWKCGYIYPCATTLKSWSLAHHSPYFWDISYPLASKFWLAMCVNLRDKMLFIMQSPSTHNFCITSSKHINYQLVSWPCVLDHQHVTIFISFFILCFWLCFYNEQFSSMNSWLKLNSIHVLYFYILQSLISLCPAWLHSWTLDPSNVHGQRGAWSISSKSY